jgi:hypothetical protein
MRKRKIPLGKAHYIERFTQRSYIIWLIRYTSLRNNAHNEHRLQTKKITQVYSVIVKHYFYRKSGMKAKQTSFHQVSIIRHLLAYDVLRHCERQRVVIMCLDNLFILCPCVRAVFRLTMYVTG